MYLYASFYLVACTSNNYNILIQDPLIIGQGNAVLKNGDSVKITLEMIEGEYFYADVARSPFRTNFEGEYQLSVVNDVTNDVLFTDGVAFETETMCFSKMFDIVVDDYNADVNPDFTIGQYGDGSHNIFKIYTILDTGIIEASPIETTVITTSNKDFSLRFKKADSQSFFVPMYDNAKGKFIDTLYKWDGEKYKLS